MQKQKLVVLIVASTLLITAPVEAKPPLVKVRVIVNRQRLKEEQTRLSNGTKTVGRQIRRDAKNLSTGTRKVLNRGIRNLNKHGRNLWRKYKK